MSSTANMQRTRGLRLHDLAGWLGLAASPVFALMAWIAANDATAMALCGSRPGALPIGGMSAMYLLMGFFHLAPWLRLASGRPQGRNLSNCKGTEP